MKISKKISLTVTCVSILSGILILIGIYGFVAGDIKDEAEKTVMGIVENEALKIESDIEKIELITDNYINILTAQMDLEKIKEDQNFSTYYADNLIPTLKGLTELSPDKNIWFTGNTPVLKSKFGISLRKIENKIIRNEYFDVIGTPSEQDEWWQGPLQKGTNWSAPYQWDDWGKGTVLISYGKRVEKDGEVIGVAGSEFYFSNVQERLAKIKILDTGTLCLFQDNLNILYHVNGLKNPYDISKEFGDIFKRELVDKN